jgi:uncharacterized protein YrrD
MYKVSEVISKPVYSIYEGIKVGTVVNFLYDNTRKRIQGFFVFDDESDQDLYLTFKNIYKMGSDNLLIRNRNKIEISKLEKKSVLNLNLISVVGEDAGEIKDVFFDKNFNICSIETKNGVVIPAKNIVNVGQDIVIFDNNEKKINVARMKPINRIMLENIPNIKVSILEEEKLATVPIISGNFDQANFIEEKKIISQPIKEIATKKLTLPPKILSNPKSIIGKYAKEMVCGLNGEVIIKKGQMVTEKIFEKAQKHSKLFELTNNVN